MLKMTMGAAMFTVLLALPALAHAGPDGTTFLTKAGLPGAAVLSIERVDLPYTGQTVYAAKLYDAKNESTVGIALDGEDNVVDIKDLAGRENRARYDLIGCINEGLLEKVRGMNPEDPIDIAIWTRSHEPDVPEKELFFNDPVAYTKATWDRQLAVEAANQQVVSLVDSLGEKAVASGYFPLVRATVPVKTLELLKHEPGIARVFYDEKAGRGASAQYPYAVGAGYLEVLGLDGTNIRIANVDLQRPDDYSCLTGIASTRAWTGTTSDHTRGTTGILRSNAGAPCNTPNGGVSNDATIYIANWEGYGSFDDAVYWAVETNDCNVLNWSRVTSDCYQSSPGYSDMVFDYVAKRYPFPTIVGSAGNSSVSNCYVENKFYNGLVVGGSNDNGTAGRADDTLYGDTTSRNFGGRELPLIAAPAVDIPVTGLNFGGTSASAPIVAGIAADIMEYNNNIKTWPEAVRAVLMASADEDIDGTVLNLGDAVDDRDGAGEVSGVKAHTLANASNKWTGTCLENGHDYLVMYANSGWDANNFFTTVWCNTSSASSSTVRFVITWASTANCPDSYAPYDCTGDQLDADLDLYIYDRSNGSLVASSTTANNNYEFVQFTAPAGVRYNIKVKKYGSFTNNSTYFSAAWMKW